MKSFFLSTLILASALVISCSTKPKPPYDARYQKSSSDFAPISMPKEKDPSEDWDRAYNEAFRFIYILGDLPQLGRNIGEGLNLISKKEAENVNAWDEVPDSSWFTNRIGRGNWSPKKSAIGPKKENLVGPDISKPWTVIKGKVDGVTPGFTILDGKKNMYFIKFDPSGYEELSSGAEIVSSHILHAAGYNVPSYYALDVPLTIFQLGKEAKTYDEYGEKRPMTEIDLENILFSVPTDKKNRVRVSASLALEGRPLGPFDFEDTRSDDKNDQVDHEHRRELRGYYIFGSWINNTDIRAQNTLDMFVGSKDKGFVRHHIIDFGTTIGAGGYRPKNQKDGYEFYFDVAEVGNRLFKFGTETPYWKKNKTVRHYSIGYFESEIFDPIKWRPAYPTPAYYNITDRDIFWAVKIISKFTDDDIALIVERANYTDEKAATYLSKTLKERRDKIVATWLNRITPIDDFEIRAENSTFTLNFVDILKRNRLSKNVHKYIVKSKTLRNPDIYSSENTRDQKGKIAVSLDKVLEKSGENFSIQIDVEKLAQKSGEENQKIGRGVQVDGTCFSTNQCVITKISR